MISILDQFSRHIFRYECIPKDAVERTNADSLALQLSFNLHSNQITTISSQSLLISPMEFFIFSLMPLRHTPTLAHLKLILSRLEEKESAYRLSDVLLQKFRKQTIRRLQQLEDRKKVFSN